LNKSLSAAQHLLGVINNVLDISRIEADRLTLDEDDFSLSRIIEEACGIEEDAARAKGFACRGKSLATCPIICAAMPCVCGR
jgi:two-component system sensor histidine kinase/response regulator